MKRLAAFCCFLWLVPSVLIAQIEYEGEPIFYETAPVTDRVARLQRLLEEDKVDAQWDDEHGWLTSLLRELEIPASSQTLVFSKTSLQIRQITPSRPRAIYFSDDIYLGWVQDGDVIELSAVDDRQGAIFYTADQRNMERLEIRRDRGQCMTCHASSKTKGVPGFLVRSVFPRRDGQPEFRMGTLTTDHRTPFEERFGGWYVSGLHGQMRHRGNAFFTGDEAHPVDFEKGANQAKLSRIVNTTPYLTPSSDIVALLVLEHQTQMHNLITKASYVTREALHQQEIMNKALERESGYVSDSTERRITKVADELVEYMLFCEEEPLTDRIEGGEEFREQFVARGARDAEGRSLRDFDLQTRLFRYPCSFLVESPSFDALPDPVLRLVERKLLSVLRGKEKASSFAHLSAADRQAILEILIATKPRFRKLASTY